MRALFIPGPALIFVTGLLGTLVADFPRWLLVPMAAVSIPCSLAYWAASVSIFKQQRGKSALAKSDDR